MPQFKLDFSKSYTIYDTHDDYHIGDFLPPLKSSVCYCKNNFDDDSHTKNMARKVYVYYTRRLGSRINNRKEKALKRWKIKRLQRCFKKRIINKQRQKLAYTRKRLPNGTFCS